MVARGGLTYDRVWTGKDGWLNLNSEITQAKIRYSSDEKIPEATIDKAVANVKPKYLVITLGADYGVDSAKGQGSTFWFTLPLYKAAQ